MSFQLMRIGGVMRILPRLEPTAFRTFSLHQPSRTHFRKATCAEVDCQHYLNGWITTVPKGSQDEHLCRTSGRKFTESIDEENLITFEFEAGQPCFRASRHEKFLEREAIHVARDGDFRGNPTGAKRIHTKPELWREEFAEHQDGLNKVING